MTDPTDQLVEALEMARDQFAFYQSEHLKAGKVDKAATNGNMARLCAEALSAHRARPTPDVGDIATVIQDACCEARNSYVAHDHGGPDPDEHWAKIIVSALAIQSAPRGEWRPELGDPVQISAVAPYAEDWRGVELFFAGIHMVPTAFGAKVNVTLSEHWPPRNGGDLTDNFPMEHIEKRVPPRHNWT